MRTSAQLEFIVDAGSLASKQMNNEWFCGMTGQNKIRTLGKQLETLDVTQIIGHCEIPSCFAMFSHNLQSKKGESRNQPLVKRSRQVAASCTKYWY